MSHPRKTRSRNRELTIDGEIVHEIPWAAPPRKTTRIAAKPAPLSSLFALDYRWVAPTSADRELARRVVAAADARIALETRLDAEPKLQPMPVLDGTVRQPRDYMRLVGAAMIAALCILPALWALHHA